MEQQAGESAHAATAPYLPGEDVPGLYGVPTPAYESPGHSASVPASSAFQTPRSDVSASSPAPEYFPAAGPSNHVPVPTPVDDKQDEDLYADPDIPSSGTATARQASAPTTSFVPGQRSLSPDEVGEATLVPSECSINHDSHADATEESSLPRYEPKSPAFVHDSQQHNTESHASREDIAASDTPRAAGEAETSNAAHGQKRDA